jgi:23S rRNA (guanosine2251-2'-O)-methyltransferase
MKIVAVLDNIRSLYNVGSMFRTADALGVEKLYLCGVTGTPDHPRMTHHHNQDLDSRLLPPKLGVAKTALAAFDTVPWQRSKSTAETLERLKEQGFYIIALETGPTSKPLSQSFLVAEGSKQKKDQHVAVIVGNERDGISFDIQALADEILCIPMHGKGISLNVAVSFGVAVWELTKNDR